MRLKKKKKPIIYAQETTQVPSQTQDSSFLYSDIYGPTAYQNIGGPTGTRISKENTPGYLPDIGYSDRFGSGSLFFQGDQQGRFKDRLSMGTGFDQYANLYNRINQDLVGPGKSDTPMTADSLSNLYNNPNELFSNVEDSSDLLYKRPTKVRGEDGKIQDSFNYAYTLTNDDLRELDPTGSIFGKGKGSRRLGVNNTLLFNQDGTFSGSLFNNKTSSIPNLTDEEENMLETFMKNKALTSYVTQGKSGKDLEKYASNIRPQMEGTMDITKSGIKPLDLSQSKLTTSGIDMDAEIDKSRNVPSFIEEEDDVASDIEGMIGPTVTVTASKDSGKGGMDAYKFDDSDPKGVNEKREKLDTNNDGVVTNAEINASKAGTETETKTETGAGTETIEEKDPPPAKEEKVEKFTIGGSEYESEEAAMEELKGKPQSQLSEEERAFVKGLKGPQTQRGKKGMRVNKYRYGGITLNKKKK